MANIQELAKQLTLAVISKDEKRIIDIVENIKLENYSLEELRELSKSSKNYLKDLKAGLLHETALDLEEFEIVVKQTDSSDTEELIDILIGL